MLHSSVYVAILILVNLNYFIQCGAKRQTVCLKELNAFSVPKTTRNASADTRPNICSTVFGCCNKTIEDEMKMNITKKLMNLTHERNERMKREFKDVYDDLKGLVENVLQLTAGSAIVSLQSHMKGVIAQHAPPHIRTLFDELQKAVTNKDLRIENSTKTFFRNFYPIVHQHYVTRTKLPKEFAKCLKDNVLVILPFEDFPLKVKALLIKKLTPVQVFLRSLQTIGHVLAAVDNIELSNECSSALAKMSYCPLCDGFSNAKPCLPYCTKVVSLCMEPYSSIEEQWRTFFSKLDDFLNLLAKSLDASSLFARLQGLLSESMSHASHSKVAAKVSKYCGNISDYTINKIVSLNKKKNDLPTRDVGNGDLYLTTDVQNSYQHLPTSADIGKKLTFLRKNFTVVRTHLKILHINVCLNDGLSTHDDDNCWVGTGLGRFKNGSGVINNITALRPVNSKTIVDDVLLLLRKAISELRDAKSWRRKTDDGSGTVYGSASGEGSGGSGEPTVDPNSGTDCDDNDDEDCVQPSGDGKVVADEPVDDTKGGVITVKSTLATTIRSGCSTSYCVQTLLVGLLLLYLSLLR